MRSLILKGHILSLLVLAVNACASANRDEGRLPLSALQAAAEVRGSCMNLLQEQISKSMDGVILDVRSDKLIESIFQGLPSSERVVIVSAASKMRGRYYSDREKMRFLSDAFTEAGICGNDQPDIDLPIFADQLNVYLLSRGVNAEEVFGGGEELMPKLLLLLLNQAAKEIESS